MHEEHIPKAIPKSIKDLLLQSVGRNQIKTIHLNFYANTSEHDFFQGNTLDDMPFVNLPNSKVSGHSVMIISNPCDTDIHNDHPLPPRVTYCAVKPLAGLKGLLEQHTSMSAEEVKLYIENVRAQRVSDIFYLPAGAGMAEERVVLMSRIAACDMDDAIQDAHNVSGRLTQKAYYLLLTKLSIHFLRFGDLQAN